MFTAIFVAVFVGAWAICGAGAWLVAAVATRGNAGLGMLPVAMATGIVAGLAVPLLARDDGVGLAMSLAGAVAMPAALLGARFFARPASRREGLRSAGLPRVER